MRTPEEFKLQAEKLNIRSWSFRQCSLCGCPIGYEFNNGKVYFDGSCDCSSAFGVEMRSWDDVARLYNMQSNENVIAKMDEHWGFIKQV